MKPARKLSRRTFSSHSLKAILLAGVAPALLAQAPKVYRAAIIGHTGLGDYGHGFDTLFNSHKNISVEALADPVESGRKKAGERSGAKRTYADFHEMLEQEKPEIVSIAPRVPEKHKEMALAALAVGAHLYLEKPLTEHLEDADAIVEAARAAKRKIAVAHTRRYTREQQLIKGLLADGFAGSILEFTIQGKQDARAGGEDLIVLGSHDFDLLRFFLGDPLWCSASVSVQGRPIEKSDLRKGREPILVAGDSVRAQFLFPKNVGCSWTSVKTNDDWNRSPYGREHWRFTIHGSKKMISYQSGLQPMYLDSPYLLHPAKPLEWQRLPEPSRWPLAPHESSPVLDLLHAIETDSSPICSGEDGRWAVEMVAAIYESERTRSRVDLPLKSRSNPLHKFR